MLPGAAASIKGATATTPVLARKVPSTLEASSHAFTAHSPFDDAGVRSLASNELLFSIGDPKTHFYAVESGALAVYEPRWNGHRAIIEFAFPGDLVGLGFLQTHTCSARATVDTTSAMLALERAGSFVCRRPQSTSPVGRRHRARGRVSPRIVGPIQSAKSTRTARRLLAHAIA